MDLLRTIARGTADDVGEDFLRSLVEHLAKALDAEIAFVAEIYPDDPERARFAAVWPPEGRLFEGMSYTIAGTPCERARAGEFVSIPVGTIAAYPEDDLVEALQLDGYLAVGMDGVDGRRLGHIGVMSSQPIRPTDDDLTALSIFGARAAAEVERRRYEVALAASRERVLRAADDERRRIGRDLHDGTQQRLVAIAQRLHMARALADGPAADHMEAAQDIALTAGAELRRLARGLYPTGLGEHGLNGALAGLAVSSTVPVNVEPLRHGRLPEDVELAFYYLVSEALTNALKHAAATGLTVTVALENGTAICRVSDDGRGGAVADGGGLTGLADRFATLGGTLDVDSALGRGTTLTARVPVEAVNELPARPAARVAT